MSSEQLKESVAFGAAPSFDINPGKIVLVPGFAGVYFVCLA